MTISSHVDDRDGKKSLHTPFESVFYIAGFALMTTKIITVAVIVIGILYLLFDFLIFHGHLV